LVSSACRAAPTEATTLHEQTLADRERILGTDHPGTLTSRNGPTVAYQDAAAQPRPRT
jgi:hypothetical protein